MNSRLLWLAGIGALIVGALVASGLFVQRGSRVIADGRIQKVRTLQVEDNTTVVLVDFRATNPAKYPLVVRDVTLEVETATGETLSGDVVADIDVERFVANYPVIGPKYNPTLRTRERIAAGETVDRMAAASFPAAESVIQGRRKLRIRIVDVDGPVTVLEQ